MDSVFQEEQDHLSETYGKLAAIEREQIDKLAKAHRDAVADKEAMADELTIDMADFDAQLETSAAIESLNRIVDAYNMSSATAHERLDKARVLLKRPYFAKIVLRVKPGAEPRAVYLGTTGMSDENGRMFIVDWRSPVAEVYYGQGHGRVSYEAYGRTITAELLLRRQFDLDRDKLHAYFDTTVAIEDPLLLKALSHQRSSRMSDITATIQKEQNAVIRHSDVDVLLVRGIAGSGKTSVLLQRIAYLLYRQRDNLNPSQVHLITPNPMFGRYIANVLPDMGERNPQTTTWTGLARRFGISPDDRGNGEQTVEMLRRIDEVCEGATLQPEDCRAVRLEHEVLIAPAAVGKIARRFANVGDSKRQCARVAEELHDALDEKIARDAASEEAQSVVLSMTIEEQCRHFGMPVDPFDDEQVREATRAYLTERYAQAHRLIDDANWLSVRRVAQRLIGGRGLKPLERAYLKMTFAGTGELDARYVMVDEVQDYTVAQLMAIERCFPRAHVLLLGDPNQAIREGTASFDQIRDVFFKARGSVSECALTTSYRSSPEITALFARLADARERMEISSVQRAGTEPRIIVCADASTYAAELERVVGQAARAIVQASAGLAAVIAANKASAAQVRAALARVEAAGELHVLDEEGTLPDSGVVLLELPLAKGLEFDHVIVADAQAENYGDDDVSRRRLYTAVSRATQEVTILANGNITPLLAKQPQD